MKRLLLLVLLGANALATTETLACSCNWPGINVQFAQATYAFAGTVTAADTTSVLTRDGRKVRQYFAAIEVETVWKGAVARSFIVEGSMLGSTCGYYGFRVGERFVVYAYADSDYGGLLMARHPRTDSCTRTRRYESAAGDIAYLGPGRSPVGAARKPDVMAAAALTVFPNPARTAVRVQLPMAGMVAVYDLLGRERLRVEGKVTEIQLNVSHLQPGVYIVAAGKERRQVVITR